MKDYDDMYLKWGVLLLANVFEKIKNNSLKSYGLCQRYYLSAPALSYTSVHSMTKVKVEIISDATMYLFFKIRWRKKVPKRVKKTLYKLMDNAVSGKTMKNWRNIIEVNLVSNVKDNIK